VTAASFMLISTKAGRGREVCRSLEEFGEIDELYMTHGEYNIVAKISIEQEKGLAEIADDVRKMQDVTIVDLLVGLMFPGELGGVV